MKRSTVPFAKAGVLFALLVLGGNAWISYRNTHQLGEKQAWVRHTQEVLAEISEAFADAGNCTTAQRGFLLTGDDTYLAPIDAARADALSRIDTLSKLTSDNPPQVSRVAEFSKTVNELMSNIDAGIARRRSEGPSSAALATLTAKSKAAMDRARTLKTQMEEEEVRLLKDRQAASKSSLERTIITLLVASGVGILTVLLSYWLLMREARNQESRAKLANYNRLLVESTGEGIFGVDLFGHCTFLNRAGEKMLGRSSADIVGRNMHELTHHTRADGTPYPSEQCPIFRAFRTGVGGRSADELFWRADGSSFPVEYAANPIRNDGEVDGAVVTFSDITERKRIEAEIRETGERFATLTDNMAQLAWMADPRGQIFWYNRRWFEYTGSTLEEMRGSGWQSVHHPDHIDRVSEKYQRKVEAGELWEDTFPLRGADGNYRWFLSRAMPIRDDQGRVVRWFGTNTDITRQREIEDSLRSSQDDLRHARDEAEAARDDARDAQEQAEAANVAKSQFLANMSHELRTPLNAVIMYSELLQEEAEDRQVPTFIPDLEKIRGAGKHLLALVNGVLDLSKIEAGKMDLYLETFDIAGMIKDVAATVQPLFQKGKNRLEMNIASDLQLMHADLTKVRQILFNLLSNACKFTDAGTVRVDAVRGLSGNGDETVSIRVSDTGVGLTQEQLAKLFQPFTQADASTTRKFGGTGLGLAISKRFSEMMGGTIVGESEFGEGATFTVVLPTKVSKSAPAESSASTQTTHAQANVASSSGGTTVLVIDDEASVQDIVSRTLASEGIRAVSALDGETGLRMARQIQPDMIFLDVMMPKMDGWAVLTALKADADTADIPVVMLTIMSETEMGYVLGAAEYLQKPIDRDRLTGVVSKYRTAGDADEVLIVEDDDPTRDVVRRSLTKQGWAVAEATNGRIGLEQVRRRIPALILLDLMMPEMDGFEFLVELRKEPRWQDIPVVVLTSKDLTNEQRAWLTGNVERIVQKGTYSREALLREVRRIAVQCAKKGDCPPDAAAVLTPATMDADIRAKSDDGTNAAS